MGSLPDKEALSLITARAGPLGMAVVSETDKNRLGQLDRDEPTEAFATREEVYKMFLSLTNTEKLKVIQEMAEHVGGKFTHEFDEGIPKKMRRKK